MPKPFSNVMNVFKRVLSVWGWWGVVGRVSFDHVYVNGEWQLEGIVA